MFLVEFLPKFHLFLDLLNSHIPECCIPLPFFLDSQQYILSLLVEFLLVVRIISSIVLHITTSIDGPLHSAQLTVGSIIQGSFSSFFIMKSATFLDILATVLLEPITIILSFKVRLTENVICFIDFFESGVIAFISIWVVLFSEMVKCLFDLRQFSCVRYS